MGTFDTYGSGLQIKAGACMMHHYKVGEDCDLEDGIYLDYGGAIVICEGKFIAEFPHIFTKYGNTINCSDIVDQYNPVAQVISNLKETK